MSIVTKVALVAAGAAAAGVVVRRVAATAGKHSAESPQGEKPFAAVRDIPAQEKTGTTS